MLLKIVPDVLQINEKHLWIDYDKEADVLYVSLRKPQDADDSELRSDGIVLRYKEENLVGVTIPNASKRK